MNATLLDVVRRRLVHDGDAPTARSVSAVLRTERLVVGSDTMLELVDTLRADMIGAGPLDPLLALPGVTDVLVNGPDEVFFDRGSGLERAEVRFTDDDDVRRLAQRIAAAAGRRLDDASPWVDARLPDGTRVHAVLSPLASPGTSVSLRIPSRTTLTLEHLADGGACPHGADADLRALVGARASFVVTGGTGSGKTTLLAALLDLVAPDERIVVVEDSAELRLEHPHVVGLEARPPNVEGAGEVTVRDLVRQALRMRPDRVVVGEVRGGEVVDLLAALNTGHEGGCGTLHANSPTDVPARFEALGVAAGLPRAAVHSQVAAGVDLVIHLGRHRTRGRHVEQIGVLEQHDGLVRAVPAVHYGLDGRREGPGIDRFRELLR